MKSFLVYVSAWESWNDDGIIDRWGQGLRVDNSRGKEGGEEKERQDTNMERSTGGTKL